MSYENITFNDPNRLKRRLQNLRIHHAFQGLNLKGQRVLDFGGGNGQLLMVIRDSGMALKSAAIFEPSTDLMRQAQQKLAGTDTQFLTRVEEIHQPYDFIFCLEVFEHLADAQIESALNVMANQLAVGGKIVVGVPNEIYLAAFFKGLFRAVRRRNDYDANWKRILGSTLGCPPQDRPMEELQPGMPYCYYHMGFDYRKLQKMLLKKFQVEKIYGSPFVGLPLVLNSEVFFILSARS